MKMLFVLSMVRNRSGSIAHGRASDEYATVYHGSWNFPMYFTSSAGRVYRSTRSKSTGRTAERTCTASRGGQ